MSEEQHIQASLARIADHEFPVHFDGTTLPEPTNDEAAPLGGDVWPNPARMLLDSVANCLMARLLFALRKFRNAPGPLEATAEAHLARNFTGKWRVAKIEVDLAPADPPESFNNLDRARARFEDFRIVTESVRVGVPVAVKVHDRDGAVVHATMSPAWGLQLRVSAPRNCGRSGLRLGRLRSLTVLQGADEGGGFGPRTAETAMASRQPRTP